MTSVSVSGWRDDGSSDVCRRCDHVECCMARGDVLPLGIVVAGYTPSAEALAKQYAREAAAQIDALINGE